MKKIRLALALVCCMAIATTAQAKEPYPIKVGMAGYSFVRFPGAEGLDYTLDMLNKLQVQYLCVKDFHLPLNSTDAQIAEFRQKLQAKNIIPYGAGPIYMKSEKEVDNAFEYARKLGVNLIIAVPDYELLQYVDQKVKEYDMKIAIHLHGPDLDVYPDAADVWNHVKNLDPRMGICMDIGHDARAGNDPVKDFQLYHTRIFDVHIKDVTASTKQGRSIEIGRGIIDFPALVKVMRKVKYSGVCSLEHEKDMNDPMIGIAESIGYFKGVLEAVK